MIFGSGIDIVHIKKLKKTTEKWGERFSHRIFTSRELNYCYQKKSPFQHLAARFAAKEAFLKALEGEKNKELKWKEIEIDNKESGQPFYRLRGFGKSLMNKEGIKPFLTISHSKDYAIAHCILVK
ncbi:MAG: holo-[acyl-carrier-protein] synthase [bacterium (Candidatus Ratteibacteria) CG_4_10_14_3_um_filter_41_18]|nr:MAG: holo-[acyl-carrier-protein] synthase [Candidatus Omnitrophica bacterium CG1_02_41_171]PIV63829.1 MAG: holo-[acyl-carrier-protein] synthase [bacterium (Candidatus Ratteibacteria) CG01_land_8_20_14_3_00_40_19]PIW74193.1 MAG: holo-[acyl-carrier-protein] synthase [bacterium (Candidatus Ratteibacteria) CG_4_8_14_3_um_filter_41_36]PIX76756.1 MAG: holo-[acyl-carrier-protein] synthase [bacterium (Candidatus Ratteibacteria) CG_4_10_14_3_um_filter_41_18]PJA61700.1 MAG: holo-[acyl-carrier-protein]